MTTIYQNYAVNERMFHCNRKSAHTTVNSTTGRRYIKSRRNQPVATLITTENIQEIGLYRNEGLLTAIRNTYKTLEYALISGFSKWIVMFSGGKDSTTLLVNVLEYYKENRNRICEIHVIYSDTRVEIPTLCNYASSFINYVKSEFPEIGVHVLEPSEDDDFWVNIIGKGYPPPHQRFRWCTDRMKIRPAKKLIKKIAGDRDTAVFTGVRFRESDTRDRQLLLSCTRGGECGQGIWVKEAKNLGVTYYAPIISWRECLVWDFLNYYAPSLNYPTEKLECIYNGRETRFGCWTCTVVRQDKAMQQITSSENGQQWLPLLNFRNWLVEIGRDPNKRQKRKNGVLGRLTIEARMEIYKRVKEIESQVGMSIIDPSKENLIFQLWNNPKYQSY